MWHLCLLKRGISVQAMQRYANAEVSHYIVADAPPGGHRASLPPQTDIALADC